MIHGRNRLRFSSFDLVPDSICAVTWSGRYLTYTVGADWLRNAVRGMVRNVFYEHETAIMMKITCSSLCGIENDITYLCHLLKYNTMITNIFI